MYRFIAAAKALFFAGRRQVLPPTPPVTGSHIAAENNDILATEAGDQLITET